MRNTMNDTKTKNNDNKEAIVSFDWLRSHCLAFKNKSFMFLFVNV